jgi:hypothetical protein
VDDGSQQNPETRLFNTIVGALEGRYPAGQLCHSRASLLALTACWHHSRRCLDGRGV